MDLVDTWGKFRILSIGASLACFCSLLAVAGVGQFGKGNDADGTKKSPGAGILMIVCGLCCCVLILVATMSLSESESAARLIGVGNIGSRLFGLGRD